MENGNTKFLFVGEGENEKTIPITVITGVLIMLVIILIGCLSLTFQKEYVVHYTDKSNLDYNVYLKQNEFYQTQFLPKDKNYISTLIDYIDADFDYNFKSTEDFDLEYTYYVTADVQVNNAEGKNIFNQEETILNKTSFNDVKNNTFSISENVKIDYDKYNRLASNFISKYDIQANSKVVVSLYVDVVGKHAEFDKELKDKAVIKLEIPLTNKTLDITMDYKLSNNVDEIFQYSSTMITNPYLFGLTIILAILDITGIIAVIVYIISNRDCKTIYAHKLKRILRDYDRYISETSNFKRTDMDKDMRVEYVKTFDDLINIRDSIEKPILFHEERAGERAVFYIFDDKIVYIYVMKAYDMKQKKEKKK
ncbi:MAG: DUF5305 domain-containing protein [Bacilli bacterium]|nr:DUF5305 domain-containing protein [Bacilli bacterium]